MALYFSYDLQLFTSLTEIQSPAKANIVYSVGYMLPKWNILFFLHVYKTATILYDFFVSCKT